MAFNPINGVSFIWKRRLPLVLVLIPVLALIRQPGRAAAADEEEERPYKAAILVEAESGDVLYEYNAHTPLPPASMTKMMTARIVMQQLHEGRLDLSDIVTTSARASKIGGSQVYLAHGEEFPVSELMKAILIHSANDACVAIAEHVAGSVEAFIDLMNLEAKALGMENTTFHSVNGLPPSKDEHEDLASAHDLSILARDLVIKYPEILDWSKIEEAPFRNGEFILTNTNKLIGRVQGVDGIKTGYFREAGHCITATAKRDGLRFIAVIMGGERSSARFAEAARLLSLGFNAYTRKQLGAKGQSVGLVIPVLGGESDSVEPILSSDVHAMIQKQLAQEVTLTLNAARELEAPVIEGFLCGEAIYSLSGREVARADLITPGAVAKQSLWGRIASFFSGD